MGTPETGWFRTESGVVLEMDLPLPDGIAGRVKSGDIARVMKGPGDRWVPWEDPATLPEVSADEADANKAAVHEELSKALDRVAELETQLAAATEKHQEGLSKVLNRAAELETQLAAVTQEHQEGLSKVLNRAAEMENQLAAVTQERDALQASITELAAAPSPAAPAKPRAPKAQPQ